MRRTYSSISDITNIMDLRKFTSESDNGTQKCPLKLTDFACLFVCFVGLFHIGNWNFWLVVA